RSSASPIHGVPSPPATPTTVSKSTTAPPPHHLYPQPPRLPTIGECFNLCHHRSSHQQLPDRPCSSLRRTSAVRAIHCRPSQVVISHPFLIILLFTLDHESDMRVMHLRRTSRSTRVL
ncbi:hypothetical protein U1Q18_014104, partial [Sarracenia purpurea var. burkii]